jgi:hypothetical protein
MLLDAAPDAESLDPAAQSAGMQLEKARSAIGAVDLPAGTLEDLDDMRALDLLETLRAVNGRAVRNPALWLLVGLMRPVATICSF